MSTIDHGAAYEFYFGSVFGAGYRAFSFWKGRVAFYAILRALGLRDSDEVIVPGYTCVVVANAVRYAGAKPVYADIAPGSYNIDPNSVEERITRNTRALLVQHTYGIPADIDALEAIASKYNLHLIEDCAHVFVGSRHRGRFLGSFGEAAFFSSQWSKPYTTGLGGMVVTSEKELGSRLKDICDAFQDPPFGPRLKLQLQYYLYRRFFTPKVYWTSRSWLHALARSNVLVGSSTPGELLGERPRDISWRMSRFQQEAGVERMKTLDHGVSHHQTLRRFYAASLQQYGWPIQNVGDGEETGLLRYPLQIANKNQLLEKCRKARVEIGSWFDSPLHPLPLSSHHLLGYRLGSCPVAESTAAKVVNLPLHERITQTEAARTVDCVVHNSSPA